MEQYPKTTFLIFLIIPVVASAIVLRGWDDSKVVTIIAITSILFTPLVTFLNWRSLRGVFNLRVDRIEKNKLNHTISDLEGNYITALENYRKYDDPIKSTFLAEIHHKLSYVMSCIPAIKEVHYKDIQSLKDAYLTKDNVDEIIKKVVAIIDGVKENEKI